jgi:phosphate transport system permease protein
MQGKNLKLRNLKDKIFHIIIFLVTCIGIVALILLFIDIFKKGLPWLTGSFITNMPSMFPEKAGIFPGLIGSLYLIGLTVLISVPVGLGCAIYLEEYAKPNKLTSFIKINISNLAGTPSIVYGLLGLAIFVKQLNFGTSILSGALTMSLVVLPIVIVSSQEALKTVSQTIRHGSYAMGATKWQTIRKVVIPCALPGILTGVILSISRAIGETAPIVMVGAFAFVATTPTGIMDSFSAIPIMIYDWISRPQEEFQNVAAAGIIVLLIVLLTTNAIAIVLRNKFQKTYE